MFTRVLSDIIKLLINAEMAGFAKIGKNKFLKKNSDIKIFFSNVDKFGYFLVIKINIILFIHLIE